MTAQEFLAGLPAKISPEALIGVETTFHFDLDKGGLQKTLRIANGKLDLLDGLVGEAKCAISAKSETLMNVVSGKENAMMAVMMGKIKISNPSEMMKYAKLLGIM
ncbi:MAG: SCP2 sterol-binding domain-containing protein [Saprospiraceae bacterium]|nr:SCP2 sterol-binding domain-containing protein [Saprospiraceae bacterium]